MPAVGEIADEFELRESAGAVRRLGELAARGPLVLIFYRGAW